MPLLADYVSNTASHIVWTWTVWYSGASRPPAGHSLQSTSCGPDRSAAHRKALQMFESATQASS